MLHATRTFFAMATFALLSAGALADVPPTQKDEVDHLLRYLESSTCVIDRNGKKYAGRDAVAHVKKKYDYFRDKIETTEEFIDYAASRSTVSERPYYVQCDGKTMTTRQWLLEELRTYRAGRVGR